MIGTAALLLLLAGRAQPDTTPRRILILYAHLANTPAMTSFASAFRVAVSDSIAAPMEIYEEFLDSDRFPAAERSAQLARYFSDKYRHFRLDVIVAEGTSSLQFAEERLPGLFPGVPIVFTIAIEPSPDTTALPRNVTGHLTRLPFASTLALARRLQPDAQQIVVVRGAAERDSILLASALAALRTQAAPLPAVIAPVLPIEQLLTYLHRLSSRTIVLVPFIRSDRRGHYFPAAFFMPALTKASSAPVYGVMGTWLGQGIVGGDVIQFDVEGTSTGFLVARVLRRQPGAPLPPVETGTSQRAVDSRQLRRFGLSAHLVPDDTQILYAVPSAWQRYHTTIVVTLAVIGAQFLLITLLLLERSARRRAQKSIAEQTAYEQMIADLTADAARLAPDAAPRAVEDAVGRIARYAKATRAVLLQQGEGTNGFPKRVTWRSIADVLARKGAVDGPQLEVAELPLHIRLTVDGEPVGVLQLYRHESDGDWPQRLVSRLDAAAEVIASAIARTQAARSIRRGEELNRAVLASMAAQIAILDNDGRIIRVNESWRGVAEFGAVPHDRDAFRGENYLDECRRAEERGCADAREVRLGIQDVLARREWSFRAEYHVTSPGLRWYELRVDRLEHGEGGAIVSHLDITERRLAELRVEETRRQIAHMGRVATVGELTAGVSHELRQPLASIRANAEAGMMMLGKAPPDVDEAKIALADIIDDTVRAAGVVEHIRLLLRRGEPQPARVDLNDICRQAVHLLHRDALFRRTRLDLSLDAGLSLVIGDPIQLQQVVLNLALNALDAASMAQQERAVTIRTSQDGDLAEVSIHDTGRGLAPEVQRHLFEPFFSTKEQGLGMGLSIVRAIVERHNGRISAENDANGGALFRVVLPGVLSPGMQSDSISNPTGSEAERQLHSPE